jgi:hypothetical protein
MITVVNRRIHVSHVGRVGVCVALLGAWSGCIDAQQSHEAPLGSISLNLVGQSATGNSYRLRNAVIRVTGAGSTVVWNTDDSPDATSLSANVVTGDYSALLQDGWILEQIDGAAAVPVVATLTSANPALFTVVPLMRTAVPLQFRIDDQDAVDLSQGYDITISVQEPPSAEMFVTSSHSAPGGILLGSIDMFPSLGRGNITPLRSIAGPATTLSVPSSIAVVGDQLVVEDRFAQAIDFFPLTANGNVSPSKQITGANTTLSFPSGMTIVNNEIYVTQGHTVIVFPVTASGNVAPIRTIRSTEFLGSIVVNNGEIYVQMGSVANVGVFPANGSGALTPTRTISDTNFGCGVLAALGNELYVSDGCAHEIRVYPTQWTGQPDPLRVISVAGASFGEGALSQGRIYSPDFFANAVQTIRVTAGGSVTPIRTISGAATNLSSPSGVALH